MTEGPQKNGKHVEIAIADDSSESETEPEPAKRFHRRISTNREIKSSVSYKIFKSASVVIFFFDVDRCL